MSELAIEIKEKPILFSGAMVRAILEGRKTQTRRVMKEQPEEKAEDMGGGFWWRCNYVQSMVDVPHPWDSEYWTAEVLESACPYGKPGDRLWVRETFNIGWLDGGKVLYRADGGSAKEAGYPSEPVYKPSIHMPRWASRLTLEIASVKVERVQDISEADAQNEGVIFGTYDASERQTYKTEFKRLWGSINEKRGFGWEKNPWVWVIEFKRVEASHA